MSRDFSHKKTDFCVHPVALEALDGPLKCFRMTDCSDPGLPERGVRHLLAWFLAGMADVPRACCQGLFQDMSAHEKRNQTPAAKHVVKEA